MMEQLKASASSTPKSLAGAIANSIRNNQNRTVEIKAIGAGAVNQAVKSIAIARGYVAPDGMDLVTIPAFEEITIDGEERTAVKFIVKDQNR